MRRVARGSTLLPVSLRLVAASLLVATSLLASACSDKPDDGTAPTNKGELAPLPFTEDTPNLMLTWVDARGATHVEVSPADVPAEGRRLVRVLLADKDEGTKDPIYVADLEQKESGGFVAKSFARSAWEKEIAKKRELYIAEASPPKPPPPAPRESGSPPSSPPSDVPAPSPADAVPSGVTVIIYGAAWCKPCHQAADFLKARGVAAVMKDIDQSPDAEAEMVAKLSKAGMRRGSIPVIDVGGKILVGYSERQLVQALASVKSGTML